MFLSRFIALLSLAVPCAAQGLEVRLYQYDWPLTDGSLIQHSRAGGFELLFDDADQQLLAAQGGGFVNIALYDNHAGVPRWLVRNLYLSFSSLEEMHAMPVVVPFGMGDANGLVWGTSILSTSVSDSAAARMPIDYIQIVQAESCRYPYQIGGWDLSSDGDDGAVMADPNLIVLDSMGVTQGPQGDPVVVVSGGIAPLPPGLLPAPVAGPMDCAPAAVAGSIAYMSLVHGGSAPSVQNIFKGLKDCMGTDAKGTTTENMLAGKNAYTCQRELPICSEILQGHDWVATVANILNTGGDVEIMYRRGACTGPGARGHIAMIRNIARFDDGTIIVEIMQPTNNADGTTSWNEVPLCFNANGELVFDPLTGDMKGCLWGFFAEVWQSGCICAN